MIVRRDTTIARLLTLFVVMLVSRIACGHQQDGHDAILEFEPPGPGTYHLHRIMSAPDGRVLDMEGRSQKLSRFLQDKITLLGFIYTTCTDPEGCPLAYRVFDGLKKEIQATPALHDRVRFVTLSFDPARDSPEVMKHYAGSRIKESRGLSWYFLTTRSVRDLLPLVEGFGQDIRYSVDKSTGRPVRELSHVLKVFLIDRSGSIREIYTSTFLHPQVVMNDIKTLLMEQGAKFP